MELLHWSLHGEDRPPLLRGHSIVHWSRERSQILFVLPSHPAPFKSCPSSSTMRFPPAQRASSQDSGTSQQRQAVTGKLWALPCDQFGCDEPCPVVCGPCWLLTRAQGSGLSSQGREEWAQAARAAAAQCWPQFLLPTAPRAIGVGLTHVWDCAKSNELLSGHFSRRQHREVVQPC